MQIGNMAGMESIFRDIRAGRRENMEWGVYGYTKAGKLRAKPETQHRTQADAVRQARRMVQLNPGRDFSVERIG